VTVRFFLAAAMLAAPAAPPLFLDLAKQAGLTEPTTYGGEKNKRYILETTGGGIAWLDIDQDGFPDLFVANGSKLEGFGQSPPPTSKLYRNLRDGRFEDITPASGLARPGWAQGVCAADFDNDGAADLFVTYWGANVLYRNSGKGIFTDVTARAGLASSRTRWGSGCAFLDYDRDGYVDLFVSHYIDFDPKTAQEPGSNARCQFMGVAVNCGPRGLKGESNSLFHNNRDGTFTDVSTASGVAKFTGNFGLGVLTGDFDNDHWPDIYIANDTNPSLLFHNKHDGTFEEIGVLAGCAYDADGKEQSGMGVTAGDYDADGWLDIFKTNYSGESASLFHNTGSGMFLEAAQETGISRNQKWVGWGCGFLDYDNDGRLDIFQANGVPGQQFRQPKLLYAGDGGKQFREVAAAALATPSVARGAAFADYDNDGVIDIAINNMHAPPSLLHGQAGAGNHWITVQLEGRRSNKSAIGARVYCTSNSRRQMDEVRSGGSYLSQNDFRIHFGLGRAAAIDVLRVEWPSGSVDELKNVPAGRVLQIVEGSHPAAK
jgi:hypothetical protein